MNNPGNAVRGALSRGVWLTLVVAFTVLPLAIIAVTSFSSVSYGVWPPPAVPAGTVLGRVVNPHTFEELEVIRAPFGQSIVVLTRAEYTNVSPGDYGFMVANGATATPA